jgi:hypothetical protein
MAFLCVSQQGEFTNTIKKITCQKLLAKKVEEKNFFPVVFSLRFFLNRVFGRFSA